MPLERRNAGNERIGSLSVCLVEGDAEQRTRERRVRRRALALSILLQTILLAAIIIAPLLAKVPPISALSFVPVPPYHPPAGPRQHEVERRAQDARPQPCRFCPPTRIPTVTPQTLPPEDPAAPTAIELEATGSPSGSSVANQLGILDPRTEPQAPRRPQAPVRLKKGGSVQAALLIYRVEPKYPELMRQIRRSGRVELHAIISADGSIESLQVISGDPGFYKSALDAVQRWHYRPTILNGQAVEVETVITVVYNIG